MMYLIVGRSGSGKDYLAAKMEKRGLKVVKSYSTRPRRTENEDSHIFVSKEEADAITDKIATTEINGFEYFATKRQVEECDIYIIDPHGLYELVENMPGQIFTVIYVFVEDDMTRKLKAINRASNVIKEEETFDKRNNAERGQFDEFEAKLRSAYNEQTNSVDAIFGENVAGAIMYANKYSEEEVDRFIDEIMRQRKYHLFAKHIAELAGEKDILTNENGSFQIKSKGEEKSVSADYIASILTRNSEQMQNILTRLLDDSDVFDQMMDIH